MKKIISGSLGLLFILFFLVSFTACEKKKTDAKKKVLIVHSYHLEYAWVKAIQDGIVENLDKEKLEIQTIYMDTKRNPSEDFKKEAGKKALERVKSFKPDVIITSDDNAQKYFGMQVASEKLAPLVFCGVNASAEAYAYPGKEVSGILERPHLKQTMEMLESLSDVKSYMVLTDDSPTSEGFIDYINSHADIKAQISTMVTTNDFEEWKKACTSLKEDALISYMYHTLNKEPKEVMQWTTANLKKPSLGFFNFAIEDGVLFGKTESGYEHGQMAAELAQDILSGKKASALPITTAEKGLILVNKKTAEAIGMDVKPLEPIADRIIQ